MLTATGHIVKLLALKQMKACLLPLCYRRYTSGIVEFVNHINNHGNNNISSVESSKTVNRFSKEDVQQLTDRQLIDIMTVTHSIHWITKFTDSRTFQKWLQAIVEEECSRRIQTLDTDLWLKVINISASPHVPIRGKFTRALAKRTKQELDHINNLTTITKLFQLFAERGSKFPIITRLEERLAKNIDQIDSKSIIPLYHGVAKNVRKHKQLLVALVTHAQRHLNDLDDASVRNVLLMITKCKTYNMQLMFNLATIAIYKLPYWSPYTVGVVAWAFAKHLIYNKALYQAISQQFVNNYQSYGQYDVAQMLYAFAKINFTPSKSNTFFETVENILDQSYDNYNPKFLMNIAWSLIVLGRYHRPLLAKIFEAISSKEWQSVSGLSVVDKVQLLQIDLAVQLEYNDSSAHFSLPSTLRNQYIKALANTKRTTSNIEMEIRRAMERIFENKQYFGTDVFIESGFSIDIAFILDDQNRALVWNDFDSFRQNEDIFAVLDTKSSPLRKVALEVDGSHHYAYKTRRQLGDTLLKHRLLKALGWKVMSVPYFEWHNARGNLKDEESYLKRKIFEINDIEIVDAT